MKIPALLACLSILALPSAQAKEVEFTVKGNDQMQFDLKTLEAAAGDTIKLTFENVGKLPKQAMGHNLVVLKKGADVAAFAMAAMTAAATEYFPEAKKDDALAHTKLLGPGEKDTITFTIAEAGEYTYICTFPGHYVLMKGVLTVK
jgi:azurin